MDQNKNQNQNQPSQNPNRKPAEGSRDNLRGNQDIGNENEAGGISNRPLEEENQEQRELPNRGQSREENR
jgi:hypothetical protein